jgi:acetyltransferase-like isoleucine patch superfamily enzyme
MNISLFQLLHRNGVTGCGVWIGDGDVIAAGAVVTKAVAANEIWAGVPAKKIGLRDQTTHP